MKERPIFFTTSDVRAILDGSKTKTLRLAQLYRPSKNFYQNYSRMWQVMPCQYGMPGDRFWVQEAFANAHKINKTWYLADYKHDERYIVEAQWRSPIRMPRRLSRIDLEITCTEVNRLHEISNSDALYDGFVSWVGNPLVWVIEFKLLLIAHKIADRIIAP